ncbi:MAG: DUF2889 domain-containing protein [Desulfotignum sp.]|nr:DUF2889 domain-containing protein [Desulfotignum sp.]MCF8125640.1 DUF2889 domain-containing protein [Desulfotignum sp.]
MLAELIKDLSRIHTRDIRMTTFPHENGQVIVVGELIDTRYVKIFDITGRVLEPGTIHHIRLFCRVAPDPLRILEAQADMPTIPMKECRTTLDRVPLLTGQEIKPGFTRKVTEIMGSTRGCTHLATLTKAMAQAMVHGWMAEKRRKPTPLPDNIEDIKERRFLVDSCRIWKKDGPKIQALARAIHLQTGGHNL